MPRNDRLQLMPVGDTNRFMPSRLQPVRVRARTMLADTHLEPHSHAWAQLAYCATGLVQVTAEKRGQASNKVEEIT
ncbi:MAG: AraC family transcriptional regulator, partial [Polaromonas sp.]